MKSYFLVFIASIVLQLLFSFLVSFDPTTIVLIYIFGLAPIMGLAWIFYLVVYGFSAIGSNYETIKSGLNQFGIFLITISVSIVAFVFCMDLLVNIF